MSSLDTTTTLLLGGVSSGKSAVARRLAMGAGTSVTFIATGIASDAEMAARIAAHRLDRPASWRVIEEPVDLLATLEAVDHGVVLLDSIDSWVGNLMHRAGCFEPGWERSGEAELRAATADAAARLMRCCNDRSLDLIAVSCEVGLGPVGATGPTRVFMDLLGHVNQLVSVAADRVALVVAGRCIELAAPSPSQPVVARPEAGLPDRAT